MIFFQYNCALLRRLKVKARYGLLVALFLLSGRLYGQTFEWAEFGSGLGQDAAQKIAIDTEGNVYMIGYFAGEAIFSSSFYGGEGVFDVYLAKYSSSGDLLWLKNAGGTQDDAAYGIGIDSEGFIYITGYFSAIAAFGKEPQQTLLTASGSSDIFLAKYDPDGNNIWAVKAGGEGEDLAFGLAVDKDDNIFITGYFSGRSYFENKTAVATGSTDVFIAKYNSDGNCQWLQSFGGTGLDKATGVAVDFSGYAYITGFFYYAASFSNSSDTLRADGLSSDIFVCKYHPDGSITHIERAGGYYNDAAFGIAVDHDKAAIITGYFLEEIEFGDVRLTNYRYDDIFVAKYDSFFNCEWALREGGNKLDIGLDVTVDPIGNVYVTGIYDSVANFSGRTASSVDYYDIFVCKYSGKGALLWMRSAGGVGSDFGNAISVRNESIYLAGYYKGEAIFGGIEAPLSKEADAFIFKMSQPVGIAEATSQNTLELYPNPTSGSFVVDLDDESGPAATVSVFDITGKLIYEDLSPVAQAGRMHVALDGINPGLYLLRIETRKAILVGRVVVN